MAHDAIGSIASCQLTGNPVLEPRCDSTVIEDIGDAHAEARQHFATGERLARAIDAESAQLFRPPPPHITRRVHVVRFEDRCGKDGKDVQRAVADVAEAVDGAGGDDD
jgi:hypothetical protein